MGIASLEKLGLAPPTRTIDRATLLATVDAVAVSSALVLALGVYSAHAGLDVLAQLRSVRLVALVSLILGLVRSFKFLGHYDELRPFWQETWEIFSAFGIVLVIDAALLYFVGLDVSRATVLGSWTTGALFTLAGRRATKSWLRSRGLWSVPAVIVGCKRNARDVAATLLDDPCPGFVPVAFVQVGLDDAAQDRLAIVRSCELPVFTISDDPFAILRRFPGARVVVALEWDEFARHRAFVEALVRACGDVQLLTPGPALPLRRAYTTRRLANDLTAIRLGNDLASRWQEGVKRAVDLVGASLLLLSLAPLLAVVAILVACEGRPVLFAHRRIGRHGLAFDCLKFRTMVPDAERRLELILRSDPDAAAEWRTTRKLRNDPRVTRLGRFLRRTSLDELPQLFNVLRGEMSLVGPRPVTEEELPRYGDYRLSYLQVRPGMTGIWQVSGRNDVDFHKRVHLDAWYAENRSLWRDFVILLMTARAVLLRQGAY